MAYASGIKKYEKKVTEVAVNNGANLTLSKDEAQTLLAVLVKVGGDPYVTRRKHTDAVLDALRDAGVEAAKIVTDYSYSSNPEVKGTITFSPAAKAKPNPFADGLVSASSKYFI